MNVLLLYSYAVEQVDRLRELLGEEWNINTHLDDEPREGLQQKLALAEVLISPRFPAGLPAAPRLGLVQSPVAGYDRIDFASLPDNRVVCNVFEHEVGVSEHAMLAILEWQIRLGQIEQRFRGGSWQDGVAALGPTHGELFAKTIGVIGVGHIGKAIAARAKAFGTRVIAVTRTPKPTLDFEWVGSMDEMNDFLPQCDFVIVACPLSPETTDLITVREIALCKKSAVLMNLARGPIINETAFYKALKSRRIAGAIIDVWYNGPSGPEDRVRPSQYPFHELDNVIMSPHSSSWSEGLLPRRWKIIAENLENFAGGNDLKNVVYRR